MPTRLPRFQCFARRALVPPYPKDYHSRHIGWQTHDLAQNYQADRVHSRDVMGFTTAPIQATTSHHEGLWLHDPLVQVWGMHLWFHGFQHPSDVPYTLEYYSHANLSEEFIPFGFTNMDASTNNGFKLSEGTVAAIVEHARFFQTTFATM